MWTSIRWAVCLSIALPWAIVADAQAGDVLPPVTERFAAEAEETPSFQKHVVPLFGRLGCNGRACHGSFQGRGDFRLSLFGYDFKADHEALLDEESPRVVANKPEESLIIVKPTSDDEHEGGQRYERGTWEHHLLARWIEGGAEYSGQEERLVDLRVEPQEIVFDKQGYETQLKVVAVWESGVEEDVTPLCRYQSNDDLVVAIDEDGKIVGGEPGDTHVVVFYDKAVVPVPVMRPVSDLTGEKYPQVAATTPIDEHVVTKLKKMGIVPSDKCDDATFLRRVQLDLTGTLPSAADVREFLADKTTDKRARKVEELMGTKAYAAWWTTKLCDFTGNNDQQLVNTTPMRNQASQEWYDWIYKRVSENTPYDQLVEGIVLGRSREPGQSYLEYCEEMCEMYKEGRSFAERSSLPHYWARREFRNPPERAISFAYAFLGIRIQCAQCHKHPFDQWSKEDFEQFTGFFAYARTSNGGQGSPEDREQYQQMLKDLGLKDKRGNELRREIPKLIEEGKTVPLPEIYLAKPRPENPNARRRPARGGNQPTTARLLGGDELQLSDYEDAREPLVEWLRSEDNGLFARAFVNRVWASYFNRGIVEPADDLSLANPPCNEPLLDYLAKGFIESGFDMKWVHREILNSDTYQRDWRPNDTNRKDERNFSRAVLRRLPAEVAYDAVVTATAADDVAEAACDVIDKRAIAIPGASARNNNNGPLYALQVFGRSTRESSCDCDRSVDATLLQTVYLRNDRDMLTMLERRGSGWLDQVARELKLQRPSGGGDAGNDRAARTRLNGLTQQLKALKARQAKLVEADRENEAKALEKRVRQLQQQMRPLRQRLGQVEDEESAEEVAKSDQSSGADSDSGFDAQPLIDELYLRTVSRFPTEQERDRSIAYLADYENKLDGLRGLLWALINTKEFIVNH